MNTQNEHNTTPGIDTTQREFVVMSFDTFNDHVDANRCNECDECDAGGICRDIVQYDFHAFVDELNDCIDDDTLRNRIVEFVQYEYNAKHEFIVECEYDNSRMNNYRSFAYDNNDHEFVFAFAMYRDDVIATPGTRTTRVVVDRDDCVILNDDVCDVSKMIECEHDDVRSCVSTFDVQSSIYDDNVSQYVSLDDNDSLRHATNIIDDNENVLHNVTRYIASYREHDDYNNVVVVFVDNQFSTLMFTRDDVHNIVQRATHNNNRHVVAYRVNVANIDVLNYAMFKTLNAFATNVVARDDVHVYVCVDSIDCVDARDVTIERLRDAQDALNDDNATLRHERNHAIDVMNDRDETIDALNDDNVILRNALIERDATIDTRDATIDAYVNDVHDMKRELNERNDSIVTYRETIIDRNATIQSLKRERETLIATINASYNDNDNVTLQDVLHVDTIKTLKRELNDRDETIKQRNEIIENMNERAHCDNDENERVIESLNDELNVTRQRVETLIDATKRNVATIDALKHELHNANVFINELRNDENVTTQFDSFESFVNDVVHNAYHNATLNNVSRHTICNAIDAYINRAINDDALHNDTMRFEHALTHDVTRFVNSYRNDS